MITNTDSYFDFASLAALKNKDAGGQSESSKAVLEKFEALFIDIDLCEANPLNYFTLFERVAESI